MTHSYSYQLSACVSHENAQIQRGNSGIIYTASDVSIEIFHYSCIAAIKIKLTKKPVETAPKSVQTVEDVLIVNHDKYEGEK